MNAAALARIAVLMSVASSALGCGAYPTTSKPDTSALVGRWHIRQSSVEGVRKLYPPLESPDASIELAADGTITFSAVPGILLDETDVTQRRLVNRQGRWELVESGGEWCVQTSITNERGGFRRPVTIWNSGRPYWLSLNCDDPDLWNFIFFDRDADVPPAPKASGK